MYASEPFPHFVDDYLAYLYEVAPSQASLDGVHLHDDLLEDLSRSAIDAQDLITQLHASFFCWTSLIYRFNNRNAKTIHK